MSVTLNPSLISNLNEFKFLPIAITKLIVDQTFQSIYSSSKGINEDTLQRIISVEVKTSCQWRSAIKSLKFLIKYAIKNQYPAKAIGVFLTEKTLLIQEIAQYICQKYEQFSKEKVQPPKQARLEEVSWAACNLKQNRNKQIVNKMYMKVYMRTLENGREQEKVVNCQLPEFKLFMAEISEIGSNMR